MEGAALAALVDEHGGALYRFARLVGRGPRADVAATVGRAWSEAAPRLDDRPAGITVRGWLLLFIVRQLSGESSQAIGGELAVAPASEFEDPDGRWAGWWKDGLAPTPEADDFAVERAIAAVPSGLAAPVVLHDVDGLAIDEVAVVLGVSVDRALDLLQHGRSAVRAALRSGGGGRAS